MKPAPAPSAAAPIKPTLIRPRKAATGAARVPGSTSWRRNHDLADLSSAGGSGTSFTSGGRLEPHHHPTARSEPSPRRGPPKSHKTRLSGDTRSPLQRQLLRHEKTQKQTVRHLADQLEAVYEHLEALENDERSRDTALSERFEADGEALQTALSELSGIADRVAAAEETQREAATSSATSAEAVASLAAEVQALRAHADASTASIDRLNIAQREALVAMSEVGALRAEVQALHEARREADEKVVRLEASLSMANETIEKLTRQQASAIDKANAQHEASLIEHAKLGSELREAALSMEAKVEEVAAAATAADATERRERAQTLVELGETLNGVDERRQANGLRIEAHTTRLDAVERDLKENAAEARESASSLSGELRALRSLVDAWSRSFAAASKPEEGLLRLAYDQAGLGSYDSSPSPPRSVTASAPPPSSPSPPRPPRTNGLHNGLTSAGNTPRRGGRLAASDTPSRILSEAAAALGERVRARRSTGGVAASCVALSETSSSALERATTERVSPSAVSGQVFTAASSQAASDLD